MTDCNLNELKKKISEKLDIINLYKLSEVLPDLKTTDYYKNFII